MRIRTFRVENFRRLKSVRVDLEEDRTIFVGANNSGKTSGTHVFQLFLGQQLRAAFQIYDFTADCWEAFNAFDLDAGDPDAELPRITLDVWFEVDEPNLHRVIDLLPDLDWEGEPVGLRMSYAPRDGKQLVANYQEAMSKATLPEGQPETAYEPWPQDLVEYLTKRLQSEYEIKYFVLDARQCGEDLTPNAGYEPSPLATARSGGAKIIDSLLRVDFLNAQRHLTDAESSHGRGEDLSRRLSRFYERNLQQLESDLDALGVIAESEARLNEHFREVFQPTLARLGEIGYPGVSNPELVVEASFNAYDILTTKGRVYYDLPAGTTASAPNSLQLPDQYNGLGFKNLIYMVVEILDFHEAWATVEQDRPPVHLVMIEEPEVHLHAQLQQVFIRKILEVLPSDDPEFRTQLVVTTHSPHIIYESDFKPIRYFSRVGELGLVQLSEVRDLSLFYAGEETTTRDFLQQYIKLTHCDLFFADGAVLVEGNVERLMLPLIIEKEVGDLRSCHLTILEVGGAFAHRFANLIAFLGLTTLVITDLDSVAPTTGPQEEDSAGAASEEEGNGGKACPVNTPGAVTSNETLRQWIPQLSSVADLLGASDDQKALAAADGSAGNVRVAYQTREPVTWNGKTAELAGRTLEEAFALQNLEWTQAFDRKHLGLRITKSVELDLSELHDELFKRVKTFDKTRFALGMMADLDRNWVVPRYIVEGLEWLSDRLRPQQEAGS